MDSRIMLVRYGYRNKWCSHEGDEGTGGETPILARIDRS